MDVQVTINEIGTILCDEFDNKVLFDTPIKIKKSPHSWPIIIHGLQFGQGSHVWFINANKKWEKLEPTIKDADLISNSVLQRIKSLSSVNSDKRSTS
jgi:hypothetical protein